MTSYSHWGMFGTDEEWDDELQAIWLAGYRDWHRTRTDVLRPCDNPRYHLESEGKLVGIWPDLRGSR